MDRYSQSSSLYNLNNQTGISLTIPVDFSNRPTVGGVGVLLSGEGLTSYILSGATTIDYAYQGSTPNLSSRYGGTTLASYFYGANTGYFGYRTLIGNPPQTNFLGGTTSYNHFGSGAGNLQSTYVGKNYYYSGDCIGLFNYNTRPTVNNSGVALSGEFNGFCLTGHDFVYDVKVNQVGPTTNTAYTGSVDLNINNLPTGRYLFKTFEMYSGTASEIPRSFISGFGILYSQFGSVTKQSFATLAGGTTSSGCLTNITGVYGSMEKLMALRREGVMNVTGSSSKFQIAFGLAILVADAAYLLSGSYVEMKRIS